jgi:hypothetical protein
VEWPEASEGMPVEEGRSRYHSRERVDRWPVRTVLPLYSMVTSVAVKWAVHP